MELGLAQFGQQHFLGASASFQRVIFFDSLGQYAPQAQWHLAKCLAAMRKTAPALLAFDQAKALASSSLDINDIALDKAEYLIRQKDWLKALVELYQLQGLSPDQSKLAEYLKGTALFATNDLDKAHYAFAQVVPENKHAQLDSIFQEARKKLNPKRVRRAELWSLFVPGSGQFISGNLKGGINSLLLVGGLGYLYYNTVNTYGLMSGVMTVFPLFARYHAGGMENAGLSMSQRQERLRSTYFDQIVHLVPTKD
jgi:tetratricopeptide (TPR) repeat protein